jgi:metallophosphoesterase superfamily enzyme
MMASLTARLGRLELAARLEGPAVLVAVTRLAVPVLPALQALARGDDLSESEEELLSRLFAAVEHLSPVDQPAALQAAFTRLSIDELRALAKPGDGEGDEA